MTITSESSFRCYIRKIGVIKISTSSELDLCDTVFVDIHFEWFSIWRINFINCTFTDCFFENIEINGVEFNHCHFSSCIFQHTIIMDCNLTDCIFDKPLSNTLYFGMSFLKNIEFNAIEFQFTTFNDCHLQKVSFNQGFFYSSKFESGDFTYKLISKLSFDNISFSSVVFVEMDLTESNFNNSENGYSFINSKLSSKTFLKYKLEGRSSIDFLTLLNSEDLPEVILKSIFGIKRKNVKTLISQIISEEMFHSVFISYSFKDAHIAIEIKRLFSKHGIKSFLFESDAPGGKKLKKIMVEGIMGYDKFLFIASESSLKSEACHYEISIAREKYYKLWTNIFLPIHIDNYLFKVREEDIPRKLSKIYWENILELRDYNSLDFTFVKNVSEIESSIIFQELLKSLKTETDADII